MRLFYSHSGAERSEEPAIHISSRRGYGFRTRCFASLRNDMLRPLALLIPLIVAAPAHADDVASFYRGKQIRFVVGSSPGGNYDLLARTVARYMPEHIPGKPYIIVQNQPSAGGMVMTNQLYALGPNDGTAIGVPINGIPAAPLLQPNYAHYDASKLIWIGNVSREPYVAYVWATAPVQSIADLMTKELIVGSTVPGSTMSDFPQLTNKILGTKFKIVAGYGSTPLMNQAMERGEIEGVAGLGWSSVLAQMSSWLKEQKVKVIVQYGFERSRLLPDVPLMLDLAKTPADRQALSMLFGRTEYGRPFFLPPDVPPDRVDAMRRAFDATMKDDGFIADAQKIGFEVDPMTGEQVQALVSELASTPADVVSRVRAALEQ
jgi:tripartite-type tricarboxylate transporter receptor subunit TctC